MDLGLHGKVAIVTGSSRGLGLAAATALVRLVLLPSVLTVVVLTLPPDLVPPM